MKDYYSILRISKNASQDEIRKSYLLLSKMFHPDKFNPINNPDEWKKSNEIFQELNEAYSILKDSASRAKYDNSTSQGYKNESKSTSSNYSNQSNSTKSNYGNISYNYKKNSHRTVLFDTLPSKIKDRIINLVNNKRNDSIILSKSKSINHWIGCILSISLFIYNFVSTYSNKWELDEAGIHILINLISSAWFTFHLYYLIIFFKSPLRKGLYITDVYFIKANYDRLIINWLLDMSDFKMTHHSKNNSYQYTSVKISFPKASYSFTLNSYTIATNLLNHINYSNKKVTFLIQNNDWSALSELDDFASISSEIPSRIDKFINRKLFKKLIKLTIPLAIFLSVLLFFLNIIFDDLYAWNKANENHNYESYRGYIAQSKAGLHRGFYIHDADDQAFNIIKGINTITSFKSYYLDTIFSFNRSEALNNIHSKYDEAIYHFRNASTKVDINGYNIFINFLRRAQEKLHSTITVSFFSKNEIPNNVEEILSYKYSLNNILKIGNAFSDYSNASRESSILNAFADVVYKVIPRDAIEFKILEANNSADIVVYYTIEQYSLYYSEKEEQVDPSLRSYYPGIRYTWYCKITSPLNYEPYSIQLISKPAEHINYRENSGIYDAMANSAFLDFENKLSSLLGFSSK